MEKLLNPYDKEYMRMAMLKHEETFKQQVYELHRLYRIQKILMKNIEITRCNDQRNNQENPRNIEDLKQYCYFVDENKPSLDMKRPSNIIEESEIELTLGPSSYIPRKKSGSPPSFSSSSSSGYSQKTKEAAFTGFENGAIKSVNDQDKARRDKIETTTHHWLFQPLSLNMT